MTQPRSTLPASMYPCAMLFGAETGQAAGEGRQPHSQALMPRTPSVHRITLWGGMVAPSGYGAVPGTQGCWGTGVDTTVASTSWSFLTIFQTPLQKKKIRMKGKQTQTTQKRPVAGSIHAHHGQ